MLKRFWNSISTIGVQASYDDALVKRVTLNNQFSFIALVIFLLSGINNLTAGDFFSFFIIEGFAAICLLSFFITKMHYHNFSVSFLFASISTAIFYFDSYSGVSSGAYLYCFPLILAIAFVFDIKTDKAKILYHFSLIMLFLLINLLTKHTLFESKFLDDAKRNQMFVFNLLFSASAVGFFIYLTIVNGLKVSELYEQRINDRNASEKAIQQALHEKEILLAELHHRVKNNLAVIASLFNLKIETIQNQEAKNILVESKNRVKSMALLHNRLYKSKNLTEINFENYTQELIDEIQASYPTISTDIKVNTTISDIKLSVNVAIPCGLILNELLSNCYKHAFINKQNGVIDVLFTSHQNQLKLIVKDNGIGLKPDYKTGDSIGMTVIQSLCEQLDGTFSFVNDNGTHFELAFLVERSQL
ncbi:MAG: sensor histidine kinase [Bacteroidia bacterium]